MMHISSIILNYVVYIHFQTAIKKGRLKLSLGLTKKMFVSCNTPKLVRVGRSAFCFLLFFFLAKGDFVGKIGGKIRFAKIKVKIVKTMFFRVIYVFF